jgi:hypothetical protein
LPPASHGADDEIVDHAGGAAGDRVDDQNLLAGHG